MRAPYVPAVGYGVVTRSPMHNPNNTLRKGSFA